MNKQTKKPIKWKAPVPKGNKPVRIPAIDRQRRFVEEYLVDFCGTRAAIRAGYSPATANEQASRLLANVNIRSLIDERKKDLLEAVRLSQLDYYSGLRRLLNFDPAVCFENGIAKDIEDIPENARRCLSKVKVSSKIINEGTDAISTTEFEFPKPLEVLKEVGRAIGITGYDESQGITEINVQINFDGKPERS